MQGLVLEASVRLKGVGNAHEIVPFPELPATKEYLETVTKGLCEVPEIPAEELFDKVAKEPHGISIEENAEEPGTLADEPFEKPAEDCPETPIEVHPKDSPEETEEEIVARGYI